MRNPAEIIAEIRRATHWASFTLSGGDWFAADPNDTPFQAADAIASLLQQLSAAERCINSQRNINMKQFEDNQKQVARLQGTLRYLQTQAENGTLHPQVVIQNCRKALEAPHG